MEILKKRQRFSDHDDLVLLREVLSHNPFENPALWQVIQENIFSLTGKTFTIRTLREHIDRLIKLWLEMFKMLKDKSGIEVVSTEKDTLCSSIYELMKEYKDNKKKKTSIPTSKLKGITARNDWTQLLEGSTENKSSEAEANIFHDHGALTLPLEDIPDGITIEVQEVDWNLEKIEQKVQESNECIENTEPKVNSARACTSANLLTPNKNASYHTPKQTASAPSTSSSKPAKILNPVRRKASTQRQGLAYLEQYDKQQAYIKRKQLELEERKILVGERMVELQEKQHVLMEFQIKKQFELIENKNNFEIQIQQNLIDMAERQDKLINLLISKIA